GARDHEPLVAQGGERAGRRRHRHAEVADHLPGGRHAVARPQLARLDPAADGGGDAEVGRLVHAATVLVRTRGALRFPLANRRQIYGVRMLSSTPTTAAAVDVLAAAFADDPLTRWLLPGDLAGAAEEVGYGPLVAASAAHRELALSADGAAVAVWLPGAAEPADDPPPIPRSEERRGRGGGGVGAAGRAGAT